MWHAELEDERSPIVTSSGRDPPAADIVAFESLAHTQGPPGRELGNHARQLAEPCLTHWRFRAGGSELRGDGKPGHGFKIPAGQEQSVLPVLARASLTTVENNRRSAGDCGNDDVRNDVVEKPDPHSTVSVIARGEDHGEVEVRHHH